MFIFSSKIPLVQLQIGVYLWKRHVWCKNELRFMWKPVCQHFSIQIIGTIKLPITVWNWKFNHWIYLKLRQKKVSTEEEEAKKFCLFLLNVMQVWIDRCLFHFHFRAMLKSSTCVSRTYTTMFFGHPTRRENFLLLMPVFRGGENRVEISFLKRETHNYIYMSSY